MHADLRDMLRLFAHRAAPQGGSKGTDADLMRQAATMLDRCEERQTSTVEQLTAAQNANRALTAERDALRKALAALTNFAMRYSAGDVRDIDVAIGFSSHIELARAALARGGGV